VAIRRGRKKRRSLVARDVNPRVSIRESSGRRRDLFYACVKKQEGGIGHVRRTCRFVRSGARDFN